MTTCRLAVVVLNWNGSDNTVACVRSLIEHGPKDQAIIVVDNGSSDNTVEEVHKLSKDVVVVELGENTGFSKGNNAGIALALKMGAEVIGLLNNDAVVESRFAEPILDRLANSPLPIAVSPAIYYRDEPAKAWFVGSRYDDVLGHGVHATDPDSRAQPFYLTGCALFAAAETWRFVGLLDERFFLNFEDLEWSRRAVEAGVTLAIVPEAIVRHGVSESIARIGPLSTYLYARNGVLLARSHFHPKAVNAQPFILESVVKPHLRMVRRWQRGSLTTLVFAIIGIVHGWRQRPSGAPKAWLQSLANMELTSSKPFTSAPNVPATPVDVGGEQ
jgi:GT2 family glycosyltransferase